MQPSKLTKFRLINTSHFTYNISI